jgi:hypothetical protein
MATETVLTYLDAYCERAGQPGLMAEPLNAITNLFFILAAIMVAKTLRRTKVARAFDLWLLVALLFAIGVGSGLWHLFASQHTVVMDVVPIGLFIYVYLASALRRLLGLNWLLVAVFWLSYFALSIVAQTQTYISPETLNGTIMYIPTYGLMIVIALALYRRNPRAAKSFVHVIMVWTLSLVFRTVDLEICEQFPYGSHFLWHMLNAWVLWRLVRILIAQAGRKKVVAESFSWPSHIR